MFEVPQYKIHSGNWLEQFLLAAAKNKHKKRKKKSRKLLLRPVTEEGRDHNS